MVESEDISEKPEWESIFQAIGHSVIILDKDHKIILANKATSTVLKKTSEEIIGQYCYA